MYEVRPDANWKVLERYLRQFPQIASKYLMEAMKKSVVTIASNVKPETPVGVSSRLRNSIGSQVVREGPMSIVGRVGSSMKEIYPRSMEFGAQPHFPPPFNLERWVHLKLGVPTGAALGVAFTIARAISRRGLEGRRYLQTGWEKSESAVSGYFAEALRKIAEAIHGG